MSGAEEEKSAEIAPPPKLWRRRLSAPETIMRKHVLAQQRSSSQDSHKSSESDRSSWSTGAPLAGNSDPNLARRRNTDIRRSTLMKRFWESSRGSMNFPTSYAEWQYTQHASPNRRASRQTFRPKLPPPTPTISNEDPYVVYSSEQFSPATTSRTDSYPPSTTTLSESMRNNNPPEDGDGTITKAYRINDNGISDVTDRSQMPSLPIKYQFVISDNEDDNEANKRILPPVEGKRTNLNVITNVQLSQSTLNLIFNQVMQDVLQKPPDEPTPIDEHISQQDAFEFKLNMEGNKLNGDDGDKDKVKAEVEANGRKLISEVNAGSPYKTKQPPSVPRLSALPRTTSMEVNISPNDSLDRDSDNSLVDSLDDPSSPRYKIKRTTNVNIKESIIKANGNSEQKIIEEDFTKTVKKSSVFYIPIDDKSESDSTPHIVSDMLPDKLKEKLLKRQLKREEKRLQERMKSFDVENGNASTYFSTSPEPVRNKPVTKAKRAKKPSTTARNNARTTLPQIEKNFRSSYTQRSLNKYRESVETSSNKTNKSFWLPKPIVDPPQPRRQPYKSKHEQKSQSSTKHIEILEIMEIVEPERGAIHLARTPKSRIPVLQSHSASSSSTRLPRLKPKPTYLDFGTLQGDPKLDQLIANILIDTLNHEEAKVKLKTTSETAVKEENNNPIEQAAEQLTQQVLDNNNLDAVVQEQQQLTENVGTGGSHAGGGMDDVPQGWITFYMLQKQASPGESTASDEGCAKTATKSTQYYAFPQRANHDDSEDEEDAEVELRQRMMHQRPRKLRKRSTNLPEGWSVTFTGNHHGSHHDAPEVEMKFKFPQLNSARTNKPETIQRQGLNFHEVCGNQPKSEIHKSKQYLQNPSSRKRLTSLSSPRATKTSRQRTLLHRRHSHSHYPRYQHDELNIATPEVLTVSGSSALQQIRKLPKINEEDLRRLILCLQQQEQQANTAIKQ